MARITGDRPVLISMIASDRRDTGPVRSKLRLIAPIVLLMFLVVQAGCFAFVAVEQQRGRRVAEAAAGRVHAGMSFDEAARELGAADGAGARLDCAIRGQPVTVHIFLYGSRLLNLDGAVTLLVEGEPGRPTVRAVSTGARYEVARQGECWQAAL